MASNREAQIEFGNEVASHLKLLLDGKTVLWPQPAGDPQEPQHVLQYVDIDRRPVVRIMY